MKPIRHANTAWVVDALGLKLGQADNPAKGQLIYLTLRDWIRSGQLSAGQRLPSTRQMASELHLGRNTLMSSLDQLQAEGFLEARQQGALPRPAPGLSCGARAPGRPVAARQCQAQP